MCKENRKNKEEKQQKGEKTLSFFVLELISFKVDERFSLFEQQRGEENKKN